jgi:hypothetical protein
MTTAIDSPSSHRALVLVSTASPDAHPHRPVPRSATFLTQLIAAARQLPQARVRRRAEPAEVIAAYRATIAKLHQLDQKSRAA